MSKSSHWVGKTSTCSQCKIQCAWPQDFPEPLPDTCKDCSKQTKLKVIRYQTQKLRDEPQTDHKHMFIQRPESMDLACSCGRTMLDPLMF